MLFLAYDLGGTKIAVGVVSSQGKILESQRAPVDLKNGVKSLLAQMTKLGQFYLKKYPQIKRVGLASAGPLDPKSGLLLDPTNFFTHGKGWGLVPIVKLLEKGLKRRVYLENDAAAAVLAECWMGKTYKIKNAMMLTLGTGLGVGVVCNGKLLRSGRELHPEAGHLILEMKQKEVQCGCGNWGCAEAYLSGHHVEKRYGVKGIDLVLLARKGNLKAKRIFKTYAKILAITLHNYIVLFSPEAVVFSGSFSKGAKFFLKDTKIELINLLKRRRQGKDLLPRLTHSALGNDVGLVGAAFVALKKGQY